MKSKEEIKERLKNIEGFIKENRDILKNEPVNRFDIEELNEDLYDLKIRKEILKWVLS
jgi:hypothetical protein